MYRGVGVVCDKSTEKISNPDVYGNTLLSRQVSDIQAFSLMCVAKGGPSGFIA